MSRSLHRFVRLLVVALPFAALATAGCMPGEPTESPDGSTSTAGPDAADNRGTSSGPQPTAVTETGTKSCREITWCLVDCDPGDQSCFDECAEAGTPEAQRAWNDYLECRERNFCRRDEKCLCDNCRSIVEHCVPGTCSDAGSGFGLDIGTDPGDTQVDGTSDGDASPDAGSDAHTDAGLPACVDNTSMSCDELFNCKACCNDESCADDVCEDHATPTAQQRLLALFQCSNRHDCDEKEDNNQCLRDHCEEQLESCFP